MTENDTKVRPITIIVVMFALSCLAGCAWPVRAPVVEHVSQARRAEDVACKKLGEGANLAKSQEWQGVRVIFTSSQAPGMRREWLLLLPIKGRPRPEALGDIYGVVVLRPENRSGLANPKSERLRPEVADEMLNWRNEGRLLSDDPWLANITPVLFGESLETIRSRWRFGQFTAEQLGLVYEYVFDLHSQSGDKDDYVPMEGTILLDADGVVLWYGVTAALTISRSRDSE